MIYLRLFLSFMKIGFCSFGGMTMIPVINDEVLRFGWMTPEEVMDIVAVAEMTPGSLGINCATFVGYQQAGFPGSIIATLGIVVPSFIIIFLISMFLDNFLEIVVIANAFKGIKVAVGFLILEAAITMIKKMHKKMFPKVIMICSFVIMLLINIFSWNFSSISLMLAAAVISLVAFIMKDSSTQKGGTEK